MLTVLRGRRPLRIYGNKICCFVCVRYKIMEGNYNLRQTHYLPNSIKMKFHSSKCKALSVTNQLNILHNLPFTILNYRLGPNYIYYVIF